MDKYIKITDTEFSLLKELMNSYKVDTLLGILKELRQLNDVDPPPTTELTVNEQRVYELIRVRPMTPSELCATTGLSKSSISYIISGRGDAPGLLEKRFDVMVEVQGTRKHRYYITQPPITSAHL